MDGNVEASDCVEGSDQTGLDLMGPIIGEVIGSGVIDLGRSELLAPPETSICKVGSILVQQPFPTVPLVQSVQLSVREIFEGVSHQINAYRESQENAPEIMVAMRQCNGVNLNIKQVHEALGSINSLSNALFPYMLDLAEIITGDGHLIQNRDIKTLFEDLLDYYIWNRWDPNGESPMEMATDIHGQVFNMTSLLSSKDLARDASGNSGKFISSLFSTDRRKLEGMGIHLTPRERFGSSLALMMEQFQQTCLGQGVNMTRLLDLVGYLGDEERIAVMDAWGLRRRSASDSGDDNPLEQSDEIIIRGLSQISEMLDVGVEQFRSREHNKAVELTAEATKSEAVPAETLPEELAEHMVPIDKSVVLTPNRATPVRKNPRHTIPRKGTAIPEVLPTQSEVHRGAKLFNFLSDPTNRARAFQLFPALTAQQQDIIREVIDIMDCDWFTSPGGYGLHRAITGNNQERVLNALINSQWYEYFSNAINAIVLLTDVFDESDQKLLDHIRDKMRKGESIRGLKPAVAYKVLAREAGIDERIAWRVGKKMGRLVDQIASGNPLVISRDGRLIHPNTSQYKLISALRDGRTTIEQIQSVLSPIQFHSISFYVSPDEYGRFPGMVETDQKDGINRRYASEACNILGL